MIGRMNLTGLPRLSATTYSSVRTLVVVSYHPVTRKKMFVPSNAVRRRLRKTNLDRQPSIEMAAAMPLSCQEMDNVTLVTLGTMGDHEARKEILKRHIMTVDRVSYDTANNTFAEILAKNEEFKFVLSLPYQIGIAMSLGAGFLSIPMVFSLSLAQTFNTKFVTTDLPEPADLETMLEVGSWAWNWMEPPLGTISFFLLCLQFARAQIENLGVKPYTELVKQWRGERLSQAFPKYDARLLVAFSESAPLYKN